MTGQDLRTAALRHLQAHIARCPSCRHGEACAFGEGLRLTADGIVPPVGGAYLGRQVLRQLPGGTGHQALVQEVHIEAGPALPPRLDLRALNPDGFL